MCPLGITTPTEWKPISPPLIFFSSHFLASLQSQDSNVGDHVKSLIDQQPQYADPNRSTYDEPSKPNTTDDQTEHGQYYTNIMNYEETLYILQYNCIFG